ncbi:hypothetical protein OsI_02037 [Oryza sativa Indica Group]|uniref:Uncharacterized protein n=1 Tax=Oryza sativa subsp. indica TaxID=39946 RepID=A2WQB1_ORYSI|nr:hypothetical protein OsI_02037 [Oryza sativa Indica Group]
MSNCRNSTGAYQTASLQQVPAHNIELWLSTGPCDCPYQTMGVRLAALNPPLHPSTRVIFGVEGARTTKCLIGLPSSRERSARLEGDAMPMTMQKRAATLEV